MDNVNTNPKITPKDFFLWFGAMIALYWSVVAFIFLFFNYIDYTFPNVLNYQPDPYDGGMPYQMASIIVLFPVYLAIIYLIRRDIARDPTRQDIWIRRWAIILTLFVAGVTMVGDIIALLTKFFRGEELTYAFLLKVVLVFLVAGVGFLHFSADLKGYWDRNPARRRLAASAFGLLALVAVLSGFLVVGTPQHARLARLDNEKVSHLQNIQWQIVNYWQQKQRLPKKLEELEDPLSGFVVPRDPQSSEAYEYRIVAAPYSFELCAEFNLEGGVSGKNLARAAISEPLLVHNNENWFHKSGHDCFIRAIDPELYPPIKK